QIEGTAARLGELVEGALPRRLVGAPAQQCRAVAKAAFADMVIPHFDDELGAQRLPLAGALGAPAARSTGGTASEAWRRVELFEAAGQLGLVASGQGCCGPGLDYPAGM